MNTRYVVIQRVGSIQLLKATCLVILNEYDKHDKVVHIPNSTTDTYFDQGSYLSLRRREYTNAGIVAPPLNRTLSNVPFNWPFSLGLPWKHGNKPLHPYMYTNKRPKSEGK